MIDRAMQRECTTLRVAAVQFDPRIGAVAENVARTVDLAARAAAEGADLVVFPELSVGGYHLPQLTEKESWFTPEDVRLEPLRAFVGRSGITLVVGAPVICAGDRLIASLVLGPDGTVVAPKVHLHGAEVDYAVPGDGPAVLMVSGWRVAFAVCADTRAPEHAASAAAAGAQVYVASVLFVAGEEQKLEDRLTARARDNGMYVVSANTGGRPLGEPSAGTSGAWSPDGRRLVVSQGRDCELVVADLVPRGAA